MNALKTGLYARSTVMPDENREAVADALRTSLAELGIRSFVGAQLVRHAVDAIARLDRVERLRDRLLAERLEVRVAGSEAKAGLDQAQELVVVVTALVNLAEQVTSPVAREEAAKLLPALRRVAEEIAPLELDVAVTGTLAATVEELTRDEVRDVLPVVFADVAVAGRGAVRALEERLPLLARDVEQERARQEAMRDVLDDKQLRELDRVRARIVREFDGYCRALLSVKDLEAKSAAAKDEKAAVPVVIDFKMVGGPSPRLS